MKKNRKLLFFLIIALIVGIILVVTIFGNNNIVEKITKSETLAKLFQSSKQIDKIDGTVLPLKISYSDLSVEETIESISKISDTVETKNVNEKDNTFAKIEVHRKKVGSTQIKVTYNIKIKNYGNNSANIDKLIAIIPGKMALSAESSLIWQERGNNNVECNDLEKIEASEEKNIKLVLQGRAADLMGESLSEVIILSSEEADQRIIEEDTKQEITESNAIQKLGETNNYSSAGVIVSIETGIQQYMYIVIVVLIVLIILGISIQKYKRKISKKNNID